MCNYVLCSSKKELLNNGIGVIIEKQKEICLLKPYDIPDNVENKTGVVGAICFDKKVLLLMTRLFLNDLEEKILNDRIVSDVDLRACREYKEMIDFLGDYSNLKLEANSLMTVYLLNNLKTVLMLSFDKHYKKYFKKYENIKTQHIIDITNEIKEFIKFIGKLIELKDPIIADVINNKTDMYDKYVFDNYFLKTTKKYKNVVTIE